MERNRNLNCSPSGFLHRYLVNWREEKERIALALKKEMSDQGNTLPPLRVDTSWHWKVADDASCQNKMMKKGEDVVSGWSGSYNDA